MSLRRLFNRLKSDHKLVQEVESLSASFDEAWDAFEPLPDESGFSSLGRAAKELNKGIEAATKKVDDKEALKALKAAHAEMRGRMAEAEGLLKKRQAAAEAADQKARQNQDEEGAAEDDESKLADPKRTRVLLKKLPKQKMEFAFAEDAHGRLIFALHKTKPGKALAGQLKKDIKLDAFTFGVASEQQGELTLDVQGRRLSGFALKVKRYLKDNKPMPYDKVRLFAGGQDITEDGDPEAKEDRKEAAAELASYRRLLDAFEGEVRKSVHARLLDALRPLSEGQDGKVAGNAKKLLTTLEGVLKDTTQAAKALVAIVKALQSAGGPKSTEDFRREATAFGRLYNTKLKPLTTKTEAWLKKAGSGGGGESIAEGELVSIRKARAAFVSGHKALEASYNDALQKLAEAGRSADPKVAAKAEQARGKLANFYQSYLRAMKDYLAKVTEIEKKGTLPEEIDYGAAESHLAFVADGIRDSVAKVQSSRN
jgi:hypothetical protein